MSDDANNGFHKEIRDSLKRIEMDVGRAWIKVDDDTCTA